MSHTLARLKSQMKQHGVTQHHVAAILRVDRTMVNKVVNGRAKSLRVLNGIRDLIATRRAR